MSHAPFTGNRWVISYAKLIGRHMNDDRCLIYRPRATPPLFGLCPFPETPLFGCAAAHPNQYILRVPPPPPAPGATHYSVICSRVPYAETLVEGGKLNMWQLTCMKCSTYTNKWNLGISRDESIRRTPIHTATAANTVELKSTCNGHRFVESITGAVSSG